MKDIALTNLCDVIIQSLQEYHERLSAYHQLNISVETVEFYRQATEAEQSNELSTNCFLN